jgi:hypothetical protein
MSSDDRKRLIDKHQKKDSLICRSAAGEGSLAFVEFLVPYPKNFAASVKKRLYYLTIPINLAKSSKEF